MLKHITADAKEDTICKAKWPAAVGGATTNPADPMHEVINIAMAEAVPDRVPAGSCHAGHMPNFSGIDSRNGKDWGCMLFNGMGGSGGSKDADGWPMIGTIAGMGGLTSASIEEVELLYPLHIDFNEIETDSMGAGKWIGGTMSTGGGIYVEHEDGSRTFTSVAGQTLVHEGESWAAYSSGGGGWGHPCDRDAEIVRRNLRDGWIGDATARDIFGVVVKDDFERTVDVQATEKLRAELRKKARPMIDPTEPAAGKWIEQNMREGDRFIEAPTIAEHFNDGEAGS